MKTMLAAILGLMSMTSAADEHDRFPVSVEALDAKRTEVFTSVDLNGDGLVSVEEFSAFRPPRRGQYEMRGRGGWSKSRDMDGGPGEGPGSDREAWDTALFSALDVDGDGVLTNTEFSSSAMAAAGNHLRHARMFERLDQNEDGYLTPEEFPPHRLATLDADHDGEITRDEMIHGRHRTDAD